MNTGKENGMTRIFLDTETTGLAPGQIAQISIIRELDDGRIEAINKFFEVDYMSKDASEVTGRDADFYKEASGGKRFKDYSTELLTKLTDGYLIAHNLQFDENFISAEFWRENIVFKPLKRFDTMTHFVDVCKLPGKYGKKYKNPKLVEVVEYYNINKQKIEAYAKQLFGIENNGFHDAMYDTTALFIAFHIRKEELEGKTDWKEQFCNL